MRNCLALLCLTAVCAIPCAAQDMLVLSLNSWRRFSIGEYIPRLPAGVSNKGTLSLPSIGYLHTIRNGFGAGLEIGFVPQRRTFENTAEFTPDNEYLTSRNREDILYVCPSAFQQLRYRAYVLTLSGALPVAYSIRRIDETTLVHRDKSSAAVVYEAHNRVELPNSLLLTIAGRVALQRRLYRGLHIGVQLSIGYMTQLTQGRSEQVFTRTAAGQRSEERFETTYRDRTSHLRLRPGCLLSYQL